MHKIKYPRLQRHQLHSVIKINKCNLCSLLAHSIRNVAENNNCSNFEVAMNINCVWKSAIVVICTIKISMISIIDKVTDSLNFIVICSLIYKSQ